MRDILGADADVTFAPRSRTGRIRQAAAPTGLWIRLPTGEREYWVAFPRGRIERDPTSALLVWTVAGLGIAALATFFIVWRLNRPLADLARAADRLGGGADSTHVEEEMGPSEVRAVMRAFNRMQDGLQKSRSDRAIFLAGVSHDLRTPLSRLRLELEMQEGRMEPATRKAMVEDLDDMNAIIDQFMDFMRSEASEPLSPVNLAELARSCAERAARGGARITCELNELPVQMLRPLAMQRAIDNLIGNALRHAPGEVVARSLPMQAPRSRCWTAARDRARDGGQAEGALYAQGRVAHRLFRAGLGLAIASRVAELHGAVSTSLPGKAAAWRRASPFQSPPNPRQPDGGFMRCPVVARRSPRRRGAGVC